MPAWRRRIKTPKVDRLSGKAELTDAVRQLLEGQNRGTERIAGTLERISTSLTTIAAASTSQLEALTAIRAGLAAQETQAKRLEEHLAPLPRLAAAQQEALTSIDGRLERTRQTEERTASALERFHQAVNALEQSTSQSSEAVRQLHRHVVVRDEQVLTLISRQTRRLTYAVCAATGAVLVAAAAWLLTLMG
jgi:chromosome segregation ATPase